MELDSILELFSVYGLLSLFSYTRMQCYHDVL